MNGIITDAAVVLGISVERLFQRAAERARFSNYLEVGTYRHQQWLHHEESAPNYVTDFCLDKLGTTHPTCATEGGILHAGSD